MALYISMWTIVANCDFYDESELGGFKWRAVYVDGRNKIVRSNK